MFLILTVEIQVIYQNIALSDVIMELDAVFLTLTLSNPQCGNPSHLLEHCSIRYNHGARCSVSNPHCGNPGHLSEHCSIRCNHGARCSVSNHHCF